MNVFSKRVELHSKKQFELINISELVESALQESGIKQGIANIFSNHTTAAIRINHNEPMLIQDIMKMLYQVVPIEANYSHDIFEMRSEVAVDERSNGHAHVKTFLLGSSESVPVNNSELQLGKQQSIFFVELDGARERDFLISIIGQ